MDVVCHMTMVLHLVLIATVGEASAFTQQLYVCPTSSPTTICAGNHYLTLDQYMDSSNGYIISSVLKLLPGQHELTGAFVIRDVKNVTIEGDTETEATEKLLFQAVNPAEL